jgi:uncharacterized membrane protein YkvA (DUF1232 family)
MMERLRHWARTLKREVTLLWLAARDPRTPLAPKLLAACVAAYALSPIDLIPDFIPVLGLLDDLLLVPVGIWLALRLMPTELLDELRIAAQNTPWPGPAHKAAFVMVAVWIGLAIGAALVLLR